MIKATDLRIGNSVYGFKTIWNIQCDDLKYEEVPYDPIPLTPEILEKCGFRKGEKWYIHQVYYKGQFDLCVNRNEITYGYKTEHGFDSKSKNIEYLHQLQNLYYALTSEELVLSIEAEVQVSDTTKPHSSNGAK